MPFVRFLYPQNMSVQVYQTCCHGATLITLQWKDANKSIFKSKREMKNKNDHHFYSL